MKIRQRLIKNGSPVVKSIVKLFYHSGVIKASFYTKAFLWHLFRGRVKIKTIDDVFKYFYSDFLKIPAADITIIEKTKSTITVAVNQNCPILNMASMMGKDTREVCLRLSNPPCEYFIRKLGKNIRVENDYFHIRPHTHHCIEKISITGASD